MHHSAASRATTARSAFPFLIAVASFSIELPIRPAFAACVGPDGAGVVTCSGSDYSPGGITYNPLTGDTLKVETGATITRTLGDTGIYVAGAANASLMVDLADGVTIITEGLNAHGLQVNGTGTGNISINSAANITVAGPAIPPAPGGIDATSGLFGWINDPLGSGNIVITQQENSTITASGFGGGGIYAINSGSGSVTLTSSGVISTTGESGYGVNAVGGGVGHTTVVLTATGNVTTTGEDATALFSLNDGLGDAFVYADGTMTTRGLNADGALAEIDGTGSSGNAKMDLSNAVVINTYNDLSKGAWVLNRGTGDAILTSAATVYTEGTESFGLHARIENSTSTAEASVSLLRGGKVSTIGESAHGIFVNNRGVGFGGTSIITMESGTSITTAGKLANGVYGLSGPLAGDGKTGGTVSFAQAAGASIAVSGEQAFGVNMNGNQAASAQIHGTVSATGQYGVGAAAFSNSGAANIFIGRQSTVTGGWQADIASTGTDTLRPSAGVLIGSGVSSQLTNLGVIGAGSDRAVADIGRQTGDAGNLVFDNSGRITGFMEMAAGGANVVNNNASGQFDVRHFADTDGDGVRDTKRVAISDFGAATSIFNNLSGATVRLAPVAGETKIDAADYYTPTTGIDSRPLEASYYTLGRSGVVQGQFTNLGTFHNAGVIDLRGSAIGNTLVMTGNAAAGGLAGNGVFVSDGGRLLLNTVMNAGVAAGGQTGSFSDVLVVDSTKMGTGATTITIDRREGTGAPTPGNGILLVEVRDKTAGASAPGVFILNGDYVANGAQAVIGGAYAYSLFQNGVASDSADGNWYLRNRGFAPTTLVYEEYPKVIVPLINVPTLQQRVGNRYWNEPAPRPRQTVFCKDPAKNYQCAVTDEQASYYVNPDGTTIIENNAIWSRIDAAHGRFQPAQSTTGAHYDTNTWKMQAGLDGLFVESQSGKLIGGVNVSYGHVSADIAAAGSRGNIRADGYGLGGTLTWYGINGFYADAQAQATWFSSDLSSATVGRKLVDGNKGFGYALSLETGQRVALDQHWTLTPQVQLVYLNAHFDSFTDPFGSAVSLLNGDSLRGRVGLAIEHQERWKQENGKVSRISAYGIANLYREFLDGTRVKVSGTELASRDDRHWGGLGFGGSYNWDDDRYSIYGQVMGNTGLTHFGNSFDVGGTLGLRVRW